MLQRFPSKPAIGRRPCSPFPSAAQLAATTTATQLRHVERSGHGNTTPSFRNPQVVATQLPQLPPPGAQRLQKQSSPSWSHQAAVPRRHNSTIPEAMGRGKTAPTSRRPQAKATQLHQPGQNSSVIPEPTVTFSDHHQSTRSGLWRRCRTRPTQEVRWLQKMGL